MQLQSNYLPFFHPCGDFGIIEVTLGFEVVTESDVVEFAVEFDAYGTFGRFPPSDTSGSRGYMVPEAVVTVPAAGVTAVTTPGIGSEVGDELIKRK